tara:strand:- start:644 stop:898 length:255 start_codon:yes stop_codon:yes gene_type:complete
MKYLFSRLPYLKSSNIHYTTTTNVDNFIFKKFIHESYDKKLKNNDKYNNDNNNDKYNNDNNNDEIKYYNQNYNIKKNSDWKFEW